jgi:hypothetical protein
MKRCIETGWFGVGAFGSIVAAILLMMPALAQAQFDYTTTNGTITITGGCPSSSGAVTIPATLRGLPVTSISGAAFYGCTSLTSITIPSSVTSISEEAFFGCTTLTAIAVDPANPSFTSADGVLFDKSQTTLIACPGGKTGAYTIPNSVTSISDGAFGCTSLTSITIPNSVTSISDGTFYGCTNLTSITIPNSVTSIGELTFSDCTSLTSITIPNSVTNISDWAFGGCTNLTSVTIPNSVISIGEGAFAGCRSLTGITIPNSVTSIADNAFSECRSLTSITVPNSVTSIGQWAFSDCTSLTSVTIGNSVTSISALAFSDCTSLTSLTIGNSVTNIGTAVFRGCTNLKGTYFQGNAPSTDGTAFMEATNDIVYYLSRTTGWGSTFSWQPTSLWTNPLLSDGSVRATANAFAFTISWAPNATLVVEASSDLTRRVWTPISTNTPSSGSWDFSDSNLANYPLRFYRVRSQ